MHRFKKSVYSFIGNLALAFLLLAGTVSCDNSFIYEQEGDCNPHYKIRFRYDWNLKYADAFSHEVGEVTLYIADEDGNVIWSRHESGAEVRKEGYTMEADVPPGTYTLLAWCGEGHRSHFSIPEATISANLKCTLLRERDAEGRPQVARELKGLYHGLRHQVEFPDDEGVHTIEMPLIKDTNDVTVVLQHLSGETVEVDRFRFEITDRNGLLDWDNTLLPDEQITYLPHTLSQGTAQFLPETKAVESVSAAVANLSVSRLMKESDVILSVYDRETEERVFSIPLVDYALLVKGKYGNMPDQEYLDRQDDYNMTFFLDENNRWVSAFIFINSWKVLLQNTPI